MQIRRGTTPYIKVYADPEQISELWVTISQFGMVKIDKTLNDAVAESDAFYIHLSQEDTLSLKGKALATIQARALFSDAEATATEEMLIYVSDVDKEGVIGVEEDLEIVIDENSLISIET